MDEPEVDEGNEDQNVIEIIENYGIEKDEAEEVRDLMDELGIDDDDAYEIWEAGL